MQAYDLYLKGRELYNRYDEPSLVAARDLFEQAIAIDPGYALAWAGVADCYGQLMQWSATADPEVLLAKGLEAAERAIALDPRLPEGYKAKALNLSRGGRPGESEAVLRQALEVDPRFAPALLNLCVDRMAKADVAGAERYARGAIEIDPQEAFAMLWLSWICECTLRDEESERWARRGRECGAGPFYLNASYTSLAVTAYNRGDCAALAELLLAARAAHVREEECHSIEAAIAQLDNRPEEARRLLAALDPSVRMVAGGLQLAARIACRRGDVEAARGLMSQSLMFDLAHTVLRLDPALHAVLDAAPFAPRVREAALVWPLEAPMLLPSVHALWREVRIESGLAPGSVTH